MEIPLTPLSGPVTGNGQEASEHAASTIQHAAQPSTTLRKQVELPDFASMEPAAYVKALATYLHARLEDEKAEEIVSIALEGKSELADSMIIASGRSARHVSAIADRILRSLKEAGVTHAKVEGQPACDWVLIDVGDVIVHLFRPEVRDFYNLERIWSEAARAPVGVEPVIDPLKN